MNRSFSSTCLDSSLDSRQRRTVEMVGKQRRKLNSKSESLGATELEANGRGNSEPISYSTPPVEVDNIVNVLLHCNQVLREFSKHSRDDLELLINVTRDHGRPKVVFSFTKHVEPSGTPPTPKETPFLHDSRCPCKGESPPREKRSRSADSIPISDIPTALEISKEDYSPGCLVAEVRSLNIT